MVAKTLILMRSSEIQKAPAETIAELGRLLTY
jgi:hypothetical protein